jgi:hypothetical protein
MRFQISFTLGTFENTGAAFSFISKVINHRLTVVSSSISYPGGDWIDSEERIIKELSLSNDNSFTAHDGMEIDPIMYGNKANVFTFIKLSPYDVERIIIDFIDDSFFNITDLMNEAALLKFNTAQLYDWYKARWQSEIFPNNFRAENRSCENRKLISHPMWTKRFGLTINLRENPGRDILTHNMHLMAAREMWFGPGSWSVFDIDNILNCRDVVKVKEIMPGVVYVKLFEPDIEDYELPEILSIQEKFRTCSKMNEIEETLNNRLSFPPAY